MALERIQPQPRPPKEDTGQMNLDFSDPKSRIIESIRDKIAERQRITQEEAVFYTTEHTDQEKIDFKRRIEEKKLKIQYTDEEREHMEREQADLDDQYRYH